MSDLFSRQRILSLWLQRLSTDRLRRLSPELPSPLIVYGRRGNADVITAIDHTAERLGLTIGLSLAQARAMHPALTGVHEDTHADSAFLEGMADWALRYTPLVACDSPDGLLLDITGCAHLHGGEQALLDDLRRRLDKAGVAHRVAIAGTIGAAHAAARYGKEGCHANGHERECLSPLALAALRLAPGMAANLSRVGFRCIGDIVDLPRAPLAARFGTMLIRQIDRALGREHEPLTPRLPVAPYVTEQRFVEPIAREEDVLAVVGKLAARLQHMLERRGDGARHLELTLFRTDGAVRRVTAGTSKPLRDPHTIQSLFSQRLSALGDELDPGFGFDLARLAVCIAAPCPDEQIGLSRHSDRATALVQLVDRLSARLGSERVRRMIASDSHIPELTAASLPAQMADIEHGWDAFRQDRAAENIGPRPLRLLDRPEPVEALAEVPDGPPLRFRWRRALHEVVAAEGPERIESEWWKDDDRSALARDYFRVEDKSGLRFWLFRAGLYRDATTTPRWFMHGTFA